MTEISAPTTQDASIDEKPNAANALAATSPKPAMPSGTLGSVATMDEMLDDLIARLEKGDVMQLQADMKPVSVAGTRFVDAQPKPAIFEQRDGKEVIHSPFAKTANENLVRQFGSDRYSVFHVNRGKKDTLHYSLKLQYSIYSIGNFYSSDEKDFISHEQSFHAPFNLGFMLRHYRPEAWGQYQAQIDIDNVANFEKRYSKACDLPEIVPVLTGPNALVLAHGYAPMPNEPEPLLKIRDKLDEIGTTLDGRVAELRALLATPDSPATAQAINALCHDLESLHVVIELTLGRDVIDGNRKYLDLAKQLESMIAPPPPSLPAPSINAPSHKPTLWFNFRSPAPAPVATPVKKEEAPLTKIEAMVRTAHDLVVKTGDRVIVSRSFIALYGTMDALFERTCGQLHDVLTSGVTDQHGDDALMLNGKLVTMRQRQAAVQTWRGILPGLSRSAIIAQNNMGTATSNLLGSHAQIVQLAAAQNVAQTDKIARDTETLLQNAQGNVAKILDSASAYSHEIEAMLGVIEPTSFKPAVTFQPQ